ncbi:MAG: hypothetical protein IJ072_07590 [Oscillospiraceae bacterium]|nr:hypothetical protein [Oscillospiraceae bacterium]
MDNNTQHEYIKAFHMMWDNYPESVRLIDKSFTVLAGNKAYIAMGGAVGTKCNVGDPALHKGCQAINSLKTGETKTVKSDVEGVTWESYWVPVAGCDELYVHFTNGINETIARMQQQGAQG